MFYFLGDQIAQHYSIFGLFMLWWGWLGFNCGSSFGITNYKWIFVSKAASTTLSSSIGGGLFSFIYCYFFNAKKYLDTLL